MGWIKPTGYIDVDGKWMLEPLAYDGLTNTYARTNLDQLQHWLVLVLPSWITCNKIRLYASEESGISQSPDVKIEVFDGANWLNVFTGYVSPKTWVEKIIPDGPNVIDRARIWWNSQGGVGRYMALFEFECYELTVNIPAIGRNANNLL